MVVSAGKKMRDKPNYRAANIRAQAALSTVVCLPRRAEKPSPEAGCPPAGLPGASIVPRDHVHGRVDNAGDEWIGIHSNGIDTCPLE